MADPQDISLEEEVPRCHLHRKPNKACKFCKAHAGVQEAKLREVEEKKKAALEKFKENLVSTSSSKTLGHSDQLAIPNFANFQSVLRDRVQRTRFYQTELANADAAAVMTVLEDTCDTCELDVRNSFDLDPSIFIASVFHLLTIKVTQVELRELFESKSCWVRCAGFLYVRLGVHHDLYWDLLGDYLMDDEQFVPFPNQEGETMTCGFYVEQLLACEKYCDMTLPRIAVARRKMITERLALYGQFRRRYEQALQVLDRYEKPEGGVEVEICRADGEWIEAKTVGARSYGSRIITVPVLAADGSEMERASIGMIICPGRTPANPKDLTRSRGQSNRELLEKCREQARSTSVTSGKNYSKNSFQHIVRSGGFCTAVGGKSTKRQEEVESDDEVYVQAAKKRREMQEHDAKMAQIVDKYCATGSAARKQGEGGLSAEGPERMRLG